MPRFAPLFVAVVVAAVGFLAVAPSLDAAKPESCKPGFVFENEDVKIWFAGKKGFFKVFDNNASDENGTRHYQYSMRDLVELDGQNETLASMQLHAAFPQTSSCLVLETEEAVNMVILVTDDVHAQGGKVGAATVTFAYHFNKTARGAKFDLSVDGWPWRSNASELRFGFDVAASGATVEPAENGVGFRDADGTSRGYIEWAPNATAYYEDGHNETAIVDGEVDANGSTAKVDLRFTNATAGYGTLVYDPWTGVGEYVVIGPALIGLAPVESRLPIRLPASIPFLL